MGRALLVLETPADKQLAVTWIGKAPVGTRVEFKASKRSLPQNDLMWALLTEIAQQLEHGGRKYDPTQWKSIFLSAFGREITFLPSLDLKTFLPIELSSSDLSKDEMTDFIEFILKEGAERGVVFHTSKNSNPSEEPSSPHAGEDEAGYANTPSSTAPDDQPSSPAADPGVTEAPASNMSPGVDAGLPSNPQLWLLNVSRMLWATANPGGDLDVLKNQKASALIAFPKPADCPDQIAAKADAVYRRCQEVIGGSLDKPDALALIAGNVGVDQDDILRKAEW